VRKKWKTAMLQISALYVLSPHYVCTIALNSDVSSPQVHKAGYRQPLHPHITWPHSSKLH
jgi:hypothetical protein